MNTFVRAISALSLTCGLAFYSVGCSETTEEGGPGATETDDGELQNEDNTFTLGLPTTSTDIEAGKSEKVTIKVNRGDQFKQPVALSFDLPDGLTVDPESPSVADDKEEIEVTISADADASEGERSIKVTGEPEEGKSVDGTLTVNVSKAE